jgi:hypothetical protein
MLTAMLFLLSMSRFVSYRIPSAIVTASATEIAPRSPRNVTIARLALGAAQAANQAKQDKIRQ